MDAAPDTTSEDCVPNTNPLAVVSDGDLVEAALEEERPKMLLPVAKDVPPRGVLLKLNVFASFSELVLPTDSTASEVVDTDEDTAVDGLIEEPNWKVGVPEDPKGLILLQVAELNVEAAKFVTLSVLGEELVPAAND